METTEEIPRDAWTAYFGDLSKNLPTVVATIEIAGEDLGDQIAAERLMLRRVAYDHKDDVVVIGLNAPGATPEEYEHLVEHPQRIFVASGIEGVELVIDIEDSKSRKHIITVQRPAALPSE